MNDLYYGSDSFQNIITRHFPGEMRQKQQQNALDELLNCFICLSKLVQPHICPCCSKLCCYGCITKWLTENRQVCPHCRSGLRVQQLVNCRFLEDLGQAFAQPAVQDPCKSHPKSSLQYYCITCSEAVCSECAMFSEHKSHEFEHIQKIYEVKVKEVNDEVEQVSSTLRKLKDGVKRVEEQVDRLNKQKEDRVQEIQAYTEGLLSKLEQNHQQRLLVLFQQKQSLTSKVSSVVQVQEDVIYQIRHMQKSEIVGRSDELVRKVESLKEQIQLIDQPQLNNSNNECNITSEITPLYVHSLFKLDHFSTYDLEAIVYSEQLIHNGIPWRLKIYPNGNGNAKQVYLSVFLEMGQLKQSQLSKRYEYKVEMINQRNPSLCVVREFSSEFETGECWGYNRFFRIDLLLKEGYLLDDTILFKYYVRAPTYYSECQDMARYINELTTNPPPLDQSFMTVKQKSLDIEHNSSIAKLKQEIEQYAEKIEQLEQTHQDESNDTSSECYECFEEDEQQLIEQQLQLQLQQQQQQQQLQQQQSQSTQIRRNLMQKFEMESFDSQHHSRSHSKDSENIFMDADMSYRDFIQKLDQLKQFSKQRGGVLSELNE